MLYLVRDNDVVYATQVSPLQQQDKNVWKQVIRLKEPILSSEYINIIDLITTNKKPYELNPEYVYNKHILKSNLQKTMRLQYIDACLSTALQLLKQDTTEFLRRIPVIILEDSLYNHYTYTHLIWLLLAHSKGYTLTEQDVQLLMDAVVTALMADYRYDIQKEPTLEEKTPECITSYIVIQLRALYGGHKEDQEFLKRLALRSPYFLENQTAQLFKVDLKTIEPFNPVCHVIHNAIDNHCCPYLLEQLQSIYTLTQEAKLVIWWHWSNPNRRVVCDTTAKRFNEYQTKIRAITKNDYNEIKYFLKDFAKRQIYKMLIHRKQYIKPKTINDYFVTK